MSHTLAFAAPHGGRCTAREYGRFLLSALLLVGSALSFSSCNGLFDGIYDHPSAEGPSKTLGFLSYDANTHRGHIMVDVTSYHHWVYLDFPTRTTTTHEIPHALSGTWDGKSAISYQHVTWPSTYRTDSIIHTDPMPTPHQWTIALHHYDVATNNGAAVATNYRSLDALPREGAAREALLAKTFSPDEWTTHQSYYDLTGIYQYYIGYQHAAFNPVLSSWMDMDVKNPPPRYTLSGVVYLLRLQDGSVAALHFPSHINPAGQKGFVTIDYIWPF